MSEDMTRDNVDWVAVLFHAAKKVKKDNRQLRQQRKDLLYNMSVYQYELDELKLLLAPIRKAYDKHPYASAKSLGQIIEEMVKLWEDENIPF